MHRTLFNRLRFLLRGLREPAPSEEAEQQAMEAFKRELGRRAGKLEDLSEPGRPDRS